MSELLIDQSLSQKRIGAKQEISLMLLQKGFVDLAEYIQSIESDNPFLEVERKKGITDFKTSQIWQRRSVIVKRH